MKFSPSTQSLVKEALRHAIGRYVSTDGEQVVMTDIYLQATQGSGELIIFNDDDEELASATIEEWMSDEEENFYKGVERGLSMLLDKMRQEGAFDKLSLLKPYSFVLVDDEKETIADLLLMDDDDTRLIDEELLKGLDEELDTFLENLLEE